MNPSEYILRRALVGSKLKTAEWDGIQAGLRDRAFFSSQIESTRALGYIRKQVAEMASGQLSPSEFRRDTRKALARLGVQPKGEGLRDIYSKSRLDVIRETNVRQARGYAQYLEGMTDGALAAFPAQELVRTGRRREPRDWRRRWADAGGRFTPDGRMIALKTDPIWKRISRFGNPYPPFDFGSGMGLADIGRREAVDLGLIEPKEEVKATPENMNTGLEATVDVSPRSSEARRLKEAFGDQIDLSGGRAVWKGEIIREKVTSGKPYKLTLGVTAARGLPSSLPPLRLPSTAVTEAAGDVTPGDVELIPSIWRRPDRVTETGEGKYRLVASTFDGGRLIVTVELVDGVPTVRRIEKK